MLLRFFYFIFFVYISTTVQAQVCTGSLGAPVVNETFGAGKAYEDGGPLPTGITTLQYSATGCNAQDGSYAISSRLDAGCQAATWELVEDHTGDKHGYAMVVNASYNPSTFYIQRVKGATLCPNTNYEFAAWIINILRNLPQTQGYTQPDITFRIEKPDGTLLKTYNTGIIPSEQRPSWHQYGTFFTSPADGSDVIVKMINNGLGGFGNDLALDDITFKPCGPIIQTGFNTLTNNAPQNRCQGDNFSYTLVASQAGYINPSYQWQQKLLTDSLWKDITGATTTSVDITVSGSAVNTYQYRIGVLNASQTGSEKCRIFSDPLSVVVYPTPVIVLNKTITVCKGNPLQLSSTGGGNGNYMWTGPNGFKAMGDSPAVTQSADETYDGVYNLTVTTNGCPAFASTQVIVFPPATVNPMADVTICAGSSVQLNAIAANATYYQWHPKTGLDNDNIANPVATPPETTTYTVQVYNDGCNTLMPSAQTTVTILKKPVADAGNDIKIFEGQTAKLTATATGDNVIRTYWTPADFLDNPEIINPVTSATRDITYTLHVVSASCGENTSNVFVRVYNKLGIPNTFSPNGDGINDLWNITNLSTYKNSLTSIYNRNGTRVYQSRGYATPWDGVFAGAALPVGTYYYVIDPRENNLPRYSGWIFLLR